MFTDLRQFEYAKEFLSTSDQRNVKQLIKKQAEWCRTTNDPKAAAYDCFHSFICSSIFLVLFFGLKCFLMPYLYSLFIHFVTPKHRKNTMMKYVTQSACFTFTVFKNPVTSRLINPELSPCNHLANKIFVLENRFSIRLVHKYKS